MYQLQLRVGVSHTRQHPDKEAFLFQGEVNRLPDGVAPIEGADIELPGLLPYLPMGLRVEQVVTNGDVTQIHGYLWCHTDGDFCYHVDSLRDLYGITRHHSIPANTVIPAA